MAQQLGDPAAEAAELRNFGLFLCEHAEQERGRRFINESLEISKRLSDIYHVGKCHQFLAWLDERQGNRDPTIAHYREALRCFEQVQSPDAEEVRADLRKLEEGEESEEDEPLTPEEVALIDALRAFFNARSWEETRAVLEREQALLLNEAASQFLAEAVEQALQANEEDKASYLAMHQKLLVRAREIGIDAAWAEFEAAQGSDEEQAGEE